MEGLQVSGEGVDSWKQTPLAIFFFPLVEEAPTIFELLKHEFVVVWKENSLEAFVAGVNEFPDQVYLLRILYLNKPEFSEWFLLTHLEWNLVQSSHMVMIKELFEEIQLVFYFYLSLGH